MALESLGEAWVDVHARVDKDFDEDIVSGVKKELKDAETDIEKVGQNFGKTLAKGMETELSTHGPDIGKSVEKAVSKEVVNLEPDFKYNVRGKDGRFIRRMVTDIEEEVERAFVAAGTSVFSRIGQGISDAIGAGFNVSPQSPLIALLIPAIGALVGLVVGAVQAVNSLIAVLSTVPALIGAIGLQVGVLFFAFKGVGTAIQGAFAATNATELKEAIKGLTPAAQTFVKQLLPLKGFFDSLTRIAQQNFFKEFGDAIPKVQKALAPLLAGGFAILATALGELLGKITLFFGSPTFREFVSALIPSIVGFLKNFGPNFITFLEGFTAFATATLPFLTTLGQILGGTLFQLGSFLKRISDDPATQQWLDDMKVTFQSVVELVASLISFVTVLFAQLNAAGGQEVLDEIVTDVQLLTSLLASDVGRKAMEGLIHVVLAALQVTTGLILAFVLLLAAFEAVGEFVADTLLPAIGNFFAMVGVGAWDLLVLIATAVGEFLIMLVGGIWTAIKWIGETWFNLQKMVDDTVNNIKQSIVDAFERLWRSINDGKGRLLLSLAQLPRQAREVLGDVGSYLYNAGRSLIQGFINGIRSMLGSLTAAAREAVGKVAGLFPGSPAEEGPLSGKGYSYYRGQNLIKDFARGIESESPTLASTSSEAISNIVFGANSIRVGFEGVVPTPQQAQTTGSGVASGIMGGLAARNARLAVRTI